MAAAEIFDTLSPAEVKQQFDRNQIVLVDVRTPQEYAFEFIPGAMLFPLAAFDAQKLPTASDKTLVFHCGSGKRSSLVAQQCAAAGLDRVAHMEGGFGAWKAAGYPFVGINPATGSYTERP